MFLCYYGSVLLSNSKKETAFKCPTSTNGVYRTLQPGTGGNKWKRHLTDEINVTLGWHIFIITRLFKYLPICCCMPCFSGHFSILCTDKHCAVLSCRLLYLIQTPYMMTERCCLYAAGSRHHVVWRSARNARLLNEATAWITVCSCGGGKSLQPSGQEINV